MEKRYAVKISIWADAHSDECHRHIEGRGIVETFLHEVAANGRRFSLVSAGRLVAAVRGACSQAEIQRLREELDDFFTVYGLDCGENGWRIDTLGELPAERMVFEDGALPIPRISLTLTLDADWAALRDCAPALEFLARLQEKLACRFAASTHCAPATPAHIKLLVHTDRPIGRIWEAGQDALKELDAAAHVMEFEVREIKEEQP